MELYSAELFGVLVWIFQIASCLDVKERGCPEPSVVEPCTCTYSPITYLRCTNIDDTETLKNVFIKSSRYDYKEVHIEQSVLQYLPSDMFQGVNVKELHLKNVTLIQLFDDPPEKLQMLDVLHIEMTNVFGGMSWELLKPMTHLRVLNIYYDSIPYLDYDFSNSVTENLKQLTFYGTETSEIHSGVFFKFTNLEKVAFDACGITTLKRDIFPKPFNVKVLYFNNNNLKTIPKDLFTNMPNLQTLGLRKNKITVLPGTAFDGSLKKLEYLLLDDNPIECDCRILWLTKTRIPVLSGKCGNMDRIELRDLTEMNLHC